MPAIDPVPLLMRNTAQGVLSRIAYDKQDGRGPSQRVIEPRIMVEGASGLLVRSIQIQPKRGVRHFMVRRILSVEPTGEALVSKSNSFCTGEVAITGWSANNKSEAASAFNSKWFCEYANAVREAIDDYQVEDWELDRVTGIARGLDMTLGQVRAVHAYIFAEYLTGYAIDGDVDPNEEEQIEQIAACLDALGWRPA